MKASPQDRLSLLSYAGVVDEQPAVVDFLPTTERVVTEKPDTARYKRAVNQRVLRDLLAAIASEQYGSAYRPFVTRQALNKVIQAVGYECERLVFKARKTAQTVRV